MFINWKDKILLKLIYRFLTSPSIPASISALNGSEGTQNDQLILKNKNAVGEPVYPSIKLIHLL